MEENNTPLTAKELVIVEETLTDLCKQLGIDGTCVVSEDGGMINVVLETEDTGLVIGYHGEILESLQLISSLIIARKLGRFARISLEVGDYKKNRSSYLEKLAIQTKEKVLSEQQEYSLPELKSWERRIVHLLLQDDTEVESTSMGEGKDRVLVIRPRQQS